jgi:hypothetical protein
MNNPIKIRLWKPFLFGWLVGTLTGGTLALVLILISETRNQDFTVENGRVFKTQKERQYSLRKSRATTPTTLVSSSRPEGLDRRERISRREAAGLRCALATAR